VETRRVTDEGPPTGVTERRRYNRRTLPGEVSPPYFEVFERIALALEAIQQSLVEHDVAKPRGRRMPSPRSE
jgi:hypothetical protein